MRFSEQSGDRYFFRKNNKISKYKKIADERVGILSERVGKGRIYGVTIFGSTTFGVTVFGIMQCLQTIYCGFGEFYVDNCGNILLYKSNRTNYMSDRT